MEVLGVAYHWTLARQAQWQRWADRLGAKLTLLHTHPDRAHHPNYVGNTHYEFSAYAAATRHVCTDGPYILVNDTLLGKHASGLWARWLLMTRNWLQTPGVHCDVYPAPRERPVEIPDPYASSWIFYLPTRADLETLSAATQQVLDQPEYEPSPVYAKFLDRWLHHPLPGIGYHGPRTPEDLKRKRQTIMWEHALSQELVTSNQLRPFTGLTYKILRLTDKILRRRQLLVTREKPKS